MPRQHTDVVVVGLGPVGSYVAWQLAMRGVRVIALEAKRREDPPSNIGAFHFESVAFERLEIPLPPDDIMICKYPGMTVHAPDPSRAVVVEGVETMAMDLSEFIKHLRGLAAEAGADLRFGESVTKTIFQDLRIVGVRSEGEKGENAFHAPVVIDATGAARAVRRFVPSMAFAGDDASFSVYMEYWADPENAPAEGLHSFMGSNAWTAKYPDYWIVGMGRPLPLEKTKAEHAAWVERNIPGKKRLLKTVSGIIPYAFPPATLVDDGVLVLGDAAATNKPFSGEGISSGMALAKIAAESFPEAVETGGSRLSMWEINIKYYTDIGAKFAFLRAMGLALMSLSDDDLNAAFDMGLFDGNDLRQTFLEYKVTKPIYKWLPAFARLIRNRPLAKKYISAFLSARKVAKLFEDYPSDFTFPRWFADFNKVMAACGPSAGSSRRIAVE